MGKELIMALRALYIAGREIVYAFGQASALNGIGEVNMMQDKFDKALGSFQQALELFDMIEDSRSAEMVEVKIKMITKKRNN